MRLEYDSHAGVIQDLVVYGCIDLMARSILHLYDDNCHCAA
jgi:hypothetical protein